MSVSTTITTILPTKFGQVTTGTVVKRYSGGQLNDDFTITKKPMWSPYQIHSDDSRDIKTALNSFKMVPMVTLSTISLLLSSALLFTMMQRLAVWTLSSMPLTVLVKFGVWPDTILDLLLKRQRNMLIIVLVLRHSHQTLTLKLEIPQLILSPSHVRFLMIRHWMILPTSGIWLFPTFPQTS